MSIIKGSQKGSNTLLQNKQPSLQTVVHHIYYCVWNKYNLLEYLTNVGISYVHVQSMRNNTSWWTHCIRAYSTYTRDRNNHICFSGLVPSLHSPPPLFHPLFDECGINFRKRLVMDKYKNWLRSYISWSWLKCLNIKQSFLRISAN